VITEVALTPSIYLLEQIKIIYRMLLERVERATEIVIKFVALKGILTLI
jgi:hypothetical protein